MSILPIARLSEEQAKEELTQLVAYQTEIRRLTNLENILRKRLYDHFFGQVKVKEGVNYHLLDDGSKVKAEVRFTRTIDEASLAANKESLIAMGIPVDQIVKYKPELVLRQYRSLEGEAKLSFDENMVTKPGLPGLTLVPSKAG